MWPLSLRWYFYITYYWMTLNNHCPGLYFSEGSYQSQWHHTECHGVWNQRLRDCLFNNFSNWQQRNIQALHCWHFVGKIHQKPVESYITLVQKASVCYNHVSQPHPFPLVSVEGDVMGVNNLHGIGTFVLRLHGNTRNCRAHMKLHLRNFVLPCSHAPGCAEFNTDKNNLW